MIRQRDVDDASLVHVLLQREERIRQEFEKKLQDLREETKLADAISEKQVVALQARIETLHGAQLLTDEELYRLEDISADYLEFKALVGLATPQMLQVSEAASKMLKMVTLSEGTTSDRGFSRQLRRKFVQ